MKTGVNSMNGGMHGKLNLVGIVFGDLGAKPFASEAECIASELPTPAKVSIIPRSPDVKQGGESCLWGGKWTMDSICVGSQAETSCLTGGERQNGDDAKESRLHTASDHVQGKRLRARAAQTGFRYEPCADVEGETKRVDTVKRSKMSLKRAERKPEDVVWVLDVCEDWREAGGFRLWELESTAAPSNGNCKAKEWYSNLEVAPPEGMKIGFQRFTPATRTFKKIELLNRHWLQVTVRHCETIVKRKTVKYVEVVDEGRSRELAYRALGGDALAQQCPLKESLDCPQQSQPQSQAGSRRSARAPTNQLHAMPAPCGLSAGGTHESWHPPPPVQAVAPLQLGGAHSAPYPHLPGMASLSSPLATLHNPMPGQGWSYPPRTPVSGLNAVGSSVVPVSTAGFNAMTASAVSHAQGAEPQLGNFGTVPYLPNHPLLPTNYAEFVRSHLLRQPVPAALSSAGNSRTRRKGAFGVAASGQRSQHDSFVSFPDERCKLSQPQAGSEETAGGAKAAAQTGGEEVLIDDDPCAPTSPRKVGRSPQKRASPAKLFGRAGKKRRAMKKVEEAAAVPQEEKVQIVIDDEEEGSAEAEAGSQVEGGECDGGSSSAQGCGSEAQDGLFDFLLFVISTGDLGGGQTVFQLQGSRDRVIKATVRFGDDDRVSIHSAESRGLVLSLAEVQKQSVRELLTPIGFSQDAYMDSRGRVENQGMDSAEFALLQGTLETMRVNLKRLNEQARSVSGRKSGKHSYFCSHCGKRFTFPIRDLLSHAQLAHR